MKVIDEVEYDLFKTVAQIVIMRGGDIERIPHNYEKVKAAALKLGFISEDNEKKKVTVNDRLLNLVVDVQSEIDNLIDEIESRWNEFKSMDSVAADNRMDNSYD